MPSRSRDIYGSRERAGKPAAERRATPKEEADWIRQTSRNRWSTLVFAAAFLLFLGIFVTIILFQQRMIRAAREAAESITHAPLPLDDTPRPPMLTLDPEGRLVLDELADLVAAVPADEEGPYPFTAHWVQQAAVQLRLAESAYRSSEWRTALAHYRNAVRILPGIEGLATTMGICALRMRDFEEAERILAAEIERGGEPRAPLWSNLAVAQMGQERFEEASRTLARAMEEDPAYAPARQNLAVLRYRSGDFEGAAEAFGEAAAMVPLNAEHAHLHAVVLLRLERWREAAEVLRESGERFPDAAPIHFRRAEALARTDADADALAALRQAVALVDARRAMVWISRSAFDPLRAHPDFQELVMELTQGLR
jgi:tetratricopeptide (TPR) repeat protein